MVTTRTVEPLIAGVDLAWGGDDSNVIRLRRGKDARSIPPIRIPGEMIVKRSDLLTTGIQGHRINTMFLDSAGISGAIAPRLRQLGYRNVIEINFGADSVTRSTRTSER